MRAKIPGRRQPWRKLLAAIAALAGGKAAILRHSDRTWSSVTFSGTRHAIALAFNGAEAVAAGESLIAVLPWHEFAIPGQIVIEALVTAADHQLAPEPRLVLELELLLLEDA